MLNNDHVSSPWRELEAGRAFLGISVSELWRDYFALGGCGSPDDLARWLTGEAEMPRIDYNSVAVALNEVFADRGQGHPVRYLDHATS